MSERASAREGIGREHDGVRLVPCPACSRAGGAERPRRRCGGSAKLDKGNERAQPDGELAGRDIRGAAGEARRFPNETGDRYPFRNTTSSALRSAWATLLVTAPSRMTGSFSV